MLEVVRDLNERLERLDKRIRGVQSVQVYQEGPKQDARAIVDHYFRQARESLVLGGIESSLLSAIDVGMQELLGIARKNSVPLTYRSCLKGLRGDFSSAEAQALLGESTPTARAPDAVDALIMKTLATLLPSAARSYEQAIRDLQTADRLSWRGPATDLRESLRETLDHLAPDDDVKGEPGFKLEKDTTGPTMKQKVRYILRKRGVSRTAAQAPESAADAVDEIVGSFVRSVYSRSNVSTHTPTDRNEILRIRDWVRVAFCELLAIRAD